MAIIKLIFAGSGSAFTTNCNNYHSNMLLVDETNHTNMMIDCGSDARHSLGELGFTYRDIDHVYISHLHADHAGGMEWLALSAMFDPSCNKPTFFAVPDIINTIWSHSLRGGLSTIQGIEADLPLFFNVVPADCHGTFTWNNIVFQTVQTLHIVNNFDFMPSYGLLFTLNNTKIFITTDTQFASAQMMPFYNQSDIIFHDCETTKTPSGVHAHFKELSQLAPEIKAKMWLYHYNPDELPDAASAGFRGFVTKGQTFEF